MDLIPVFAQVAAEMTVLTWAACLSVGVAIVVAYYIAERG